jgi:hypothetical protein
VVDRAEVDTVVDPAEVETVVDPVEVETVDVGGLAFEFDGNRINRSFSSVFFISTSLSLR